MSGVIVGTKVRTADNGFKPVEQLSEGDEIVTAKGNIAKVVSVSDAAVDDAVKITVQGHPDKVTVSASQKVVVVGGFKVASEVKPGERILVDGSYAPVESVEKVDAKGAKFVTVEVDGDGSVVAGGLASFAGKVAMKRADSEAKQHKRDDAKVAEPKPAKKPLKIADDAEVHDDDTEVEIEHDEADTQEDEVPENPQEIKPKPEHEVGPANDPEEHLHK